MKTKPKHRRHLVKTLIKWCLHTTLIVIAILATLLLVQAFASRKMPDLETWHHTVPDGEFVAAALTPNYTFEQYLQLEDTLFDGLSQYMLDPDDLQGHSPFSRFVRGGMQDPARQPRNWNRTVELVPNTPKGGVLLLHGLSDSPYSMRSLAELFYGEDYYVLVMRMPGHGTVPAGLLEVTWQDWVAAVKLGARHVNSRIDDSLPFYVAGYSNGGALAVHYSLEALGTADRIPDRLFLFSPAIGITPFARIARLDAFFGFIPYFEKSNWLSIEPAFDPYKYNSFTKNAGTQSWRLARAIQSQLDAHEGVGQLAALPPILSFQSVVDDTVEAEVLITGLYERLQSSTSEVVFFDVNHSAKLDSFISLDWSHRLDRLMQRRDLSYTVTRLINHGPQSLAVVSQSRGPNSDTIVEEILDLAWPVGVFSLAHVAIPFPPDDPLYGATQPEPPVFGLHIGTLAPRGERHVLNISASQLIRIRHNPFHDYIARRIKQTIHPEPVEGDDALNR